MAENLEQKLAKIERGDSELLKLFQQLIRKGDDMYVSDFLMLGALKRTLALSQGFRAHIRDRNFTCAGTLVRAQLDTALRVNALSLCTDTEKFASAVLGGERVDRMKDKHGKRMTDAYLAEKLSETFPWVQSMYASLCDFGHFSNRHIFTSMSIKDPEEHIVHFQIGPKDPPHPDSDYFEIVEGYYETMRITGLLAGGWGMAMREIRDKKPIPVDAVE
jgi:hypothetical protein